jgi:hypothetical protein
VSIATEREYQTILINIQTRPLVAAVLWKETVMNAHPDIPQDRVSFNSALEAIHAEHAAMRRLADVASSRPELCADVTLSLADAMAAHERSEAGLFPLPFLTRTPEAVVSSAIRARRHCEDYTGGDFRRRDPHAVAALFIEALLAHLDAEDAWLADEKAQKNERLLTAI